MYIMVVIVMTVVVRNTLTREKKIHKYVYRVEHEVGTVRIVFRNLTSIVYPDGCYTVFCKVM